MYVSLLLNRKLLKKNVKRAHTQKRHRKSRQFQQISILKLSRRSCLKYLHDCGANNAVQKNKRMMNKAHRLGWLCALCEQGAQVKTARRCVEKNQQRSHIALYIFLQKAWLWRSKICCAYIFNKKSCARAHELSNLSIQILVEKYVGIMFKT